MSLGQTEVPNNQMMLENPLPHQSPLHQRMRVGLLETAWQPIGVRQPRETPKVPFLIARLVWLSSPRSGAWNNCQKCLAHEKSLIPSLEMAGQRGLPPCSLSMFNPDFQIVVSSSSHQDIFFFSKILFLSTLYPQHG